MSSSSSRPPRRSTYPTAPPSLRRAASGPRGRRRTASGPRGRAASASAPASRALARTRSRRRSGPRPTRGASWRIAYAVVLLLLIVALTGLGVHMWAGGGEDVQAAPAPTTTRTSPTLAPTTTGAVGSAEPTEAAGAAEPAPSAPQTAGPRLDENGFAHSDATGDGTWTIADPVPPSRPGAATVYRYVLQVEGGTGVDAAQAAVTVESVLNDERGWRTVEGVSFEQVSDPAAADFVLSIATPPTVDGLCSPLETASMWSCRNEGNVVLNSDRWSYGSPTFSDIDSYHVYVVNHEVGHFLGHGHVLCAGPGLKSPTMAQQSRTREGGCTANGWPAEDNQPS